MRPRPSTVSIAAAVGLHGEHQAGAHAVAVEQDGAGAAHAVLAADMGAGEPERVAQEIGEQQTRLDRVRDSSSPLTVTLMSRGLLMRRSGARRHAAASARPASTPTR